MGRILRFIGREIGTHGMHSEIQSAGNRNLNSWDAF